jgi:putative effector of murein hydrolase LrgA (UPF0299 family)
MITGGVIGFLIWLLYLILGCVYLEYIANGREVRYNYAGMMLLLIISVGLGISIGYFVI